LEEDLNVGDFLLNEIMSVHPLIRKIAAGIAMRQEGNSGKCFDSI